MYVQITTLFYLDLPSWNTDDYYRSFLFKRESYQKISMLLTQLKCKVSSVFKQYAKNPKKFNQFILKAVKTVDFYTPLNNTIVGKRLLLTNCNLKKETIRIKRSLNVLWKFFESPKKYKHR